MLYENTVLVTGGCGYIGSQVCLSLNSQGYHVVVLDNLSTGYADSLLNGEDLVVGNVGDEQVLHSLFSRYKNIKTIIHFAASIIVCESVSKPIDYYENNVANTIKLLKVAREYGIDHFILSSSAAVYGEGDGITPLDEMQYLKPYSPYGHSKHMDEQIVKDCAIAYGFTYGILRYFNVAGADQQLRLGQRGPVSSHLIKIACEAAVGKRECMHIFGGDYPTPDGTCIRDYVHVEDLADAHVALLNFLLCEKSQSIILNCGYNEGYSVQEVVNCIQDICHQSIDVRVSDRRPGDLPFLVAESTKIYKTLNWNPKYKGKLREIIESALAWERKLIKKNS